MPAFRIDPKWPAVEMAVPTTLAALSAIFTGFNTYYGLNIGCEDT
jgi:hypothetical protein